MGKSRSFWDPQDGTVREFDEVLGRRREKYKRSSEILHAMDMYRLIEETLEHIGWELPDERAKRHLIQSALLEKARREDEDV